MSDPGPDTIATLPPGSQGCLRWKLRFAQAGFGRPGFFLQWCRVHADKPAPASPARQGARGLRVSNAVDVRPNSIGKNTA